MKTLQIGQYVYYTYVNGDKSNHYTIGMVVNLFNDGYFSYDVIQSSNPKTLIGKRYECSFTKDNYIIADTLEQINKIRTFQ